MKLIKCEIVIPFGKTSTIKYFDQYCDEENKVKRYCKIGWRLLLLFKGMMNSLFTYIYFVPASPTETKKPLEKRLNEQLKKHLPEILLVAEQKEGNQLENTRKFLMSKDYEVIEKHILWQEGGTWGRWKKDNSNKEDILINRAIEIRNEMRIFILKQIS